jgi:hypothetical protein
VSAINISTVARETAIARDVFLRIERAGYVVSAYLLRVIPRRHIWPANSR